ncbi:alpha/beta hydrolase family protein [Peptoniphilus raoultii]|uniref:alpha/beta hydrolase family protein n=1 Tax=Peptoniphilus raoultii TaxID=1776387 RepID=UPI0008DB1197|nr:prolyl oligopeptidase family serine peptidase [Peptoniphilus raoultii]
MKYLKMDFSNISELEINEIPLYMIEPINANDNTKNIIFYHGWSSDAKGQIFRGNIFASYGYRVFLPDAIHHGRRGKLDYDNDPRRGSYFLECIYKNLKESQDLLSYIKENYKGEIGIAGHSMGAISSACIYNIHKDFKIAFIYNGIIDYEYLVNQSIDKNEDDFESIKKIKDYLLEVNPMKNKENFIDRPLVLFNGDEDKIINPDVEERCANELKKIYKNKELLNFDRFDLTTHQLIMPMIEEALIFAKEKIKF